jgi:protein-S-isoprenylcysteine O-methyltransferase Ste14
VLDKLEHKIPPPVWGLIFAVAMSYTATALPLVAWDSQFNYVLLVLLAGMGGILDLYCVVGFIKAKTTINPLTPNAAILVTHGMYRYSRNPMYLGLLLILAGWGCYLGALSALLFLPLFIATINRLQIRPEEIKLQQLWGTQYIEYCQEVRRWL